MGACPLPREMMAVPVLAVLIAFTVDLLPERIDLVSLVLQAAGLGALVGQLAGSATRRNADAGARIGSLFGAGFGLAAGLLVLLSRAVS